MYRFGGSRSEAPAVEFDGVFHPQKWDIPSSILPSSWIPILSTRQDMQIRLLSAQALAKLADTASEEPTSPSVISSLSSYVPAGVTTVVRVLVTKFNPE